jgi:hypothetical protein
MQKCGQLNVLSDARNPVRIGPVVFEISVVGRVYTPEYSRAQLLRKTETFSWLAVVFSVTSNVKSCKKVDKITQQGRFLKMSEEVN